jgi:hypothetical protein
MRGRAGLAGLAELAHTRATRTTGARGSTPRTKTCPWGPRCWGTHYLGSEAKAL